MHTNEIYTMSEKCIDIQHDVRKRAKWYTSRIFYIFYGNMGNKSCYFSPRKFTRQARKTLRFISRISIYCLLLVQSRNRTFFLQVVLLGQELIILSLTLGSGDNSICERQETNCADCRASEHCSNAAANTNTAV